MPCHHVYCFEPVITDRTCGQSNIMAGSWWLPEHSCSEHVLPTPVSLSGLPQAQGQPCCRPGTRLRRQQNRAARLPTLQPPTRMQCAKLMLLGSSWKPRKLPMRYLPADPPAPDGGDMAACSHQAAPLPRLPAHLAECTRSSLVNLWGLKRPVPDVAVVLPGAWPAVPHCMASHPGVQSPAFSIDALYPEDRLI